MRNKKLVRSLAAALLTALILAVPFCVSAATELPIAKGATGDEVVRLQMRLKDLGYISFRPTGRYGDMTVSGVRAFQENSGLEADGITGESVWDSVFLPGAVRAKISGAVDRVYGPGQTNPLTEFGEKSDWAAISAQIETGAEFVIIDVNTSAQMYVKRTGGTNHAEVEPASQSDFEVYKTMFGGGFTWEKRAVVAVVGEKRYAASLMGMPDANDVVADNGIEGGLDLYFTGSTADFAGTSDVEHKANIIKAAGGA